MKKEKDFWIIIGLGIVILGLVITNVRISKVEKLTNTTPKNTSSNKSNNLETGMPEVIYSKNETYMKLVFPINENFYVSYYDENIFYSDPNCENEIETPRFLSEEIQYAKSDSGLEIYCVLAENGDIVYSPRSRNLFLVAESKYERWKELDRLNSK